MSESTLYKNIDHVGKWAYLVQKKYNFKCARCEHPKYEIHHIVRRQCKKLATTVENGIPLCHKCHTWVHNNKPEAIEFYKYIGVNYQKLIDIKWS